MKFASLSLALCPLAAVAYPDVQARGDTSGAYQTDLFEGTRLQEDESTLNASDLTYTQQNGRPWFQPLGAQRAGSSGPLLLQDFHLIDTMATFNRERIPERVVHARGAGAHGYFEVTSDYASKYSVADVFQPGTKTSITMRFSTVGGARGSADSARDPRGFSIKMRTKKGILDW
jgi:catalase